MFNNNLYRILLFSEKVHQLVLVLSFTSFRALIFTENYVTRGWREIRSRAHQKSRTLWCGDEYIWRKYLWWKDARKIATKTWRCTEIINKKKKKSIIRERINVARWRFSSKHDSRIKINFLIRQWKVYQRRAQLSIYLSLLKVPARI